MPSDPDQAEALRHHAAQALKGGRHDEALAALEAAVRADPASHLAHHDLGGMLKLLGRLPEAEARLRKALALAPDDPRTRHALGIVILGQGRYVEGWPLYDARHAIAELRLIKPALPYPEWRGEDLAGKRLLIFPEQGLGDQIQYARFAPWLAAKGGDVTLICNPALASLFEASFTGVRVIAASGQVNFPDPDYWVMSGSITGRAGLEPADLPNAPYLRAKPAPTSRGRIGVATRGNPAHTNDAHRSLPPAQAAQLLALPGALSLHPEDTGAKDMAETAAVIAGLERVITVDTAVAHLAAALGKPTGILLPRVMTDWRWMEDRADSPWYPTARLYRQPQAGDWTSVLAAVRRDLGSP